jgi:signal transduction histidine kinase
MMHEFLFNNRDDLIARCKSKVALRPKRAATDDQLKNGIPLFLDQLTRTLEAEQRNDDKSSLEISGSSGGDLLALSEVGVSAATHGKALLTLGYSVDQVVHDYGDLCQAITDLAFERDAPFSIDEYRTLNRCLDNAIADAVSAFSVQRDSRIAEKTSTDSNQRLGFLVHELRNSLNVAKLATQAMEMGGLTITGATGAVLKRSHASMQQLIDSSLADVRNLSDANNQSIFSLASFISEAQASANLEATSRGCSLAVAAVDPVLRIQANRDRLLGALANLLGNAFKFTQAHTQIALTAYLFENRILVDVEDCCGGLPEDYENKLFTPFVQIGDDKSGLGLGLAVARQSVEAFGGTLTVRNLPDHGCIFTISLPNCTLERRT